MGPQNHKFTVISIPADTLELLRKALEDYASSHDIEVKDLNYSRMVFYFTLVGTMDDIKQFIKAFAPVWHVHEMGVSEFARIMEVSDDEAEEWYKLINECQSHELYLHNLESILVTKFLKVSDIEKLRYLKGHFFTRFSKHIQAIIDRLEGKEDDFTAWLKRQLQKENLLQTLTQLQLPDGRVEMSSSDLVSILDYIRTSNGY